MAWERDKAMCQLGFHQLPVSAVLAGLSGECTPQYCTGTWAQDTQGNYRLLPMTECSQDLGSSLLGPGFRRC